MLSKLNKEMKMCKNCKKPFVVNQKDICTVEGFCCVYCADVKIYKMLKMVLKNQVSIFKKIEQKR